VNEPGLDLRLAGAAAGAWLVALVCLGRSPAVAACVAAAALCGLLVVVIARWPGSATVALALLGVVAGALVTGLLVWSRDGSPLAALARQRATVALGLVLTDDPRPVSRGPGFGPPQVVLRARVVKVTAAGRTTAVGGRVVVTATDPRWSRLLPSQRVVADGRLSPPRGGDLTVALLAARGPPADVEAPSPFQRAAGRLRAGLRAACRGLPAKERGLLPGLVVGDTTGLDPALADDFRATGLTHLVAVSGTNCAIVCGAVLLLVRRLRAGPRTAAVLAGLALAGFVVLVRPSPSVLRAAVMGALALLALATGRPRAALPGLCAAVLILVLADPSLAGSPGFALSVLATAGLLVLAPPWRDALRRRRLPGGVAEALAVPAAAQVACAPVIAAIGGQVGIVAVPANLLAVPAVAPATLLGIGATVLSGVWPGAAAFLARIAGAPTGWLVFVAQHGARVGGGSIAWPAGPTGGLLLAGVLAGALQLARAPAVRRTALCVGCVFAVVFLPVRAMAPGWPPPGWLMVVCDVGQGDALVLNAGPHTAVVVDTGPDPVLVDRCLRRLGVRRIPLLVLTHLHADHVGGLAGLIRGRAVAAIEVGPSHEPAAAWAHVERQAHSAGVALVRSSAGQRRTVGAVHLQVLGPFTAFHGTRSDPNNSSIVLRVGIAGRSLLLAGDAEVQGQDALLAARQDLRADVLKVPHHGSAYSDPRFLDRVRPLVALVSVGAGNRYGHPSLSVLARLRRLGAQTRRTDRDGDLAVAVRAGRLYVVTTGAHRAGGSGVRRPAARGPPGRPRSRRAMAPATGVGMRT
jgi:competence protein ComEC